MCICACVCVRAMRLCVCLCVCVSIINQDIYFLSVYCARSLFGSRVNQTTSRHSSLSPYVCVPVCVFVFFGSLGWHTTMRPISSFHTYTHKHTHTHTNTHAQRQLDSKGYPAVPTLCLLIVCVFRCCRESFIGNILCMLVCVCVCVCVCGVCLHEHVHVHFERKY